jgi:hypothetical protein
MRSENSLRISPPFPKAQISPPLPKAKISPPLPNPKHPPPLQRGPGGFNDRPRSPPNISPFRKTPNISPFRKGGRGDFHGRRGLQTILPYHPELKPPARVLRRTMTDAERLLWSRVRGKQIGPVQFYRQKPLVGYIVDFYAPKAKPVIPARKFPLRAAGTAFPGPWRCGDPGPRARPRRCRPGRFSSAPAPMPRAEPPSGIAGQDQPPAEQLLSVRFRTCQAPAMVAQFIRAPVRPPRWRLELFYRCL